MYRVYRQADFPMMKSIPEKTKNLDQFQAIAVSPLLYPIRCTKLGRAIAHWLETITWWVTAPW